MTRCRNRENTVYSLNDAAGISNEEDLRIFDKQKRKKLSSSDFEISCNKTGKSVKSLIKKHDNDDYWKKKNKACRSSAIEVENGDKQAANKISITYRNGTSLKNKNLIDQTRETPFIGCESFTNQRKHRLLCSKEIEKFTSKITRTERLVGKDKYNATDGTVDVLRDNATKIDTIGEDRQQHTSCSCRNHKRQLSQSSMHNQSSQNSSKKHYMKKSLKQSSYKQNAKLTDDNSVTRSQPFSRNSDSSAVPNRKDNISTEWSSSNRSNNESLRRYHRCLDMSAKFCKAKNNRRSLLKENPMHINCLKTKSLLTNTSHQTYFSSSVDKNRICCNQSQVMNSNVNRGNLYVMSSTSNDIPMSEATVRKYGKIAENIKSNYRSSGSNDNDSSDRKNFPENNNGLRFYQTQPQTSTQSVQRKCNGNVESATKAASVNAVFLRRLKQQYISQPFNLNFANRKEAPIHEKLNYHHYDDNRNLKETSFIHSFSCEGKFDAQSNRFPAKVTSLRDCNSCASDSRSTSIGARKYQLPVQYNKTHMLRRNSNLLRINYLNKINGKILNKGSSNESVIKPWWEKLPKKKDKRNFSYSVKLFPWLQL